MKPVAICIPARNEAAELPMLFGALDRLEYSHSEPLAICLLLDNSTDSSAVLARDYRDRSRHQVWIEQVAGSPANAGLARHRAMMLGQRALGTRDGHLLTTDADSIPASNWVVAMSNGLAIADVVLGKVVRTGERPHEVQDRIEAYYDALFAMRRYLDPVPWESARTHHHAAGANMGIEMAAYRKLGGFAAVVCGEDARLADDASRAGLCVRRDADCVVRTSDRREGRVHGGMATELQRLERDGSDGVNVAHPADAAWQYRAQALARAVFAEGRLEHVAVTIGLSHEHVRGVARECPNAEAFAMRIVPEPPGGMRSVALAVAEGELARLFDAREAA